MYRRPANREFILDITASDVFVDGPGSVVNLAKRGLRPSSGGCPLKEFSTREYRRVRAVLGMNAAEVRGNAGRCSMEKFGGVPVSPTAGRRRRGHPVFQLTASLAVLSACSGFAQAAPHHPVGLGKV